MSFKKLNMKNSVLQILLRDAESWKHGKLLFVIIIKINFYSFYSIKIYKFLYKNYFSIF